MKQIYFLTTIILLTFYNVNGQTITVSGSCYTDGDYTLSGNYNGRPSYESTLISDFLIRWSGTRWELIAFGSVESYNTDATPTPPASSFSAWSDGFCGNQPVLSGDGTYDPSTLGITGVQLTNKKIKLFPNPSSSLIQISGLKETEKYSIFNVLGSEVKKGNISNNEKLDVQNLNNGLYFMKFENGSVIKFIKE